MNNIHRSTLLLLCGIVVCIGCLSLLVTEVSGTPALAQSVQTTATITTASATKTLQTTAQVASPTGANSSAQHTSSAHEHSLDWILFIIIALALGTAARHWGTKIPFVRIFPFTVLLMLLGFGLGIADRLGAFSGTLSSFDGALNWAANIQPSVILFIFLPTLIFEAAFAIDTHTFKKSVINALILAVPGMILATVLTAFSVMFVLDLPGWSWYIALLFGALISATDPVAVVALLRELGASKKLSTLIDGESLLNDGVAIVIFTVFLEYVRMGAGLEALDMAVLSQSFMKTVVGGTIIGLIIAATTIAWVRRVFNDALVEITVLVIAAYLTFYIAEHFLHVSGILGLMALGLVMSGVGRSRISPQVEHFLHNFWEMAAYLANTLIFIIVGVLIAERTVFSGRDVLNLLLLYVAIHFIRAVMIAVFYPLLQRFGYGIAPKDTVILWWGALRGALGLCLCLLVMQEPSIPKTIQQQIMFYVAGIVFLTLTVNATTIKWIIGRLGLTKISAARQAMLGNAMQELTKELGNVVLRYKYRNIGRGVRWSAVREYLPHHHREERTIAECSDAETLAEIRLRLLETERALYQEQFHKGLLRADSVHALTSGISVIMDDGGKVPLSERPYLQAMWNVPSYWDALANVPLLGKFFRYQQAQRRSLIYDTAKACIEAQEELFTLVKKAELYDINQNDTFDENERQMAQTLAAEIQSVCHTAEKIIADLRITHPNVAIAAETVDAIRSTLNAELTVIERLHHDGLLKLEETAKLTQHVEMQMKAIVNYPATVTLPGAEEILRELPWLTAIPENELQAFITLCEEYHAPKGVPLVVKGASSEALFIVLRGELIADDGSLGSIGTMLGAYSAASGLAEAQAWTTLTPTDTLRISSAHLRTFLNAYPTLAHVFWKWAAAEHIALLLHQGGYMSEQQSDTLDWLLASSIHILAPNDTLTIRDNACILLSGVVKDHDGHTLTAPTLIKSESLKAEHTAVLYTYSLVAETERLLDGLITL